MAYEQFENISITVKYNKTPQNQKLSEIIIEHNKLLNLHLCEIEHYNCRQNLKEFCLSPSITNSLPLSLSLVRFLFSNKICMCPLNLKVSPCIKLASQTALCMLNHVKNQLFQEQKPKTKTKKRRRDAKISFN